MKMDQEYVALGEPGSRQTGHLSLWSVPGRHNRSAGVPRVGTVCIPTQEAGIWQQLEIQSTLQQEEWSIYLDWGSQPWSPKHSVTKVCSQQVSWNHSDIIILPLTPEPCFIKIQGGGEEERVSGGGS